MTHPVLSLASAFGAGCATTWLAVGAWDWSAAPPPARAPPVAAMEEQVSLVRVMTRNGELAARVPEQAPAPPASLPSPLASIDTGATPLDARPEPVGTASPMPVAPAAVECPPPVPPRVTCLPESTPAPRASAAPVVDPAVFAAAEHSARQVARQEAGAALTLLEGRLMTGDTDGAAATLEQAASVLDELAAADLRAAREAIDSKNLSTARAYIGRAVARSR